MNCPYLGDCWAERKYRSYSILIPISNPTILRLSRGRRSMNIDRYDFNGFTINLYLDEQGDWLAHLQELPNISVFGDTPQAAIEELKLA
jgi:hypothetical protein